MRIFLSHASTDFALAAFLEDCLRLSFAGAEVFRASRPGQMPSGSGWFEQIARNLFEADAFVVVVTPQSHDRWWVLFEAGAALRSGKRFVLVLAGDLKPGDVNEPLRYLTLRSIEQAEDAQQAFRDLGGVLEDPATFVAQVKALAEQGRVSAARHGGFEFIEHNGGVYAWNGPLADLKDDVSTVPEPAGLADALHAARLTATWGILRDPIEGGRGFSPLYLVKGWRFKARVMRASDSQVLWVKPWLQNAGSQSPAVAEDWKGVEVQGRFFAWDGPLHTLPDRPPILAPEIAITAMKSAGMTPAFGRQDKLRDHIAKGSMHVYETDRRTWKRELLLGGDGSQVLLVREGGS